jgi:hypothetical protein
VPAFLYQVRGDTLTDPSDVRAMYDNIPIADKKLQWIEDTTARWDGYLEFQRRPQPMLDRFALPRVVLLRMISTWPLLAAESTRISRVEPLIQASCSCSAAVAK